MTTTTRTTAPARCASPSEGVTGHDDAARAAGDQLSSPVRAAEVAPAQNMAVQYTSAKSAPAQTTPAAEAGEWEDPDLGASTAEYAVIVLAAAAFGGVMAAVLSSDSVSGMLLGIIQKALAV